MKARICHNCRSRGTASKEQIDAVALRLGGKRGHNWSAFCTAKNKFRKNKDVACDSYVEK